MNELKHLKRLSSVKSNAGVKLLTPVSQNCSHCPMHVATGIARQTKGLSSLLIGTPECSIYSGIVQPKSAGADEGLHWMYVLDENEVVFGCRDGLMAALRKMDKAGAKAILLIVTCIPELIGEDIEGIVHEIQPELTTRLTFVQVGHFKCNSYPSGYWKTMLALGRLMEPRAASERTINVLGLDGKEDETPLLSSLRKKGFILRFISINTPLNDILAAPDAIFNLVLSPDMQPLAELMEKSFGTRRVGLYHLFGVEDVDRAYGQIADQLGVSFEGEFKKSRTAALELERDAKEKLEGLRYITYWGYHSMPIPLALYLAGFGMDPLLLHMEEFYPEDKAHAKALVAAGHNPLVCHITHDDENIPLLESLSPDLCFGLLPEGKGGISSIDMYDICAQTGYERTIHFLRDTLVAMGDTRVHPKTMAGGL